MKLSILVTQYKETDEVVKPLLDSIAIQQGVDFGEIGVTIVNDGSGVTLSEKLLGAYPFRIDYIARSHGGVSAARNTAMDAAEGEYIMFCDADDMFSNACGIAMLFREMEKGFDSLWSVFAEEVKTPEGMAYLLHEQDANFVHGKVHRRQFLLDHDLRWDEALTDHEDGYFHALLQCMGPDMRYCERAFYLWRWRDGSVCRSKDFMLRTYPKLLDVRDHLADELIRRGMEDRARDVAAQTVLDAYYAMQKPEWKTHRGYRQAAEERFAAFWQKHGHWYEELPEREKARLSGKLRERNVREGMEMETVTLGEWLYSMGSNPQSARGADSSL